jgi:hypothetical protein
MHILYVYTNSSSSITAVRWWRVHGRQRHYDWTVPEWWTRDNNERQGCQVQRISSHCISDLSSFPHEFFQQLSTIYIQHVHASYIQYNTTAFWLVAFCIMRFAVWCLCWQRFACERLLTSFVSQSVLGSWESNLQLRRNNHNNATGLGADHQSTSISEHMTLSERSSMYYTASNCQLCIMLLLAPYLYVSIFDGTTFGVRWPL